MIMSYKSKTRQKSRNQSKQRSQKKKSNMTRSVILPPNSKKYETISHVAMGATKEYESIKSLSQVQLLQDMLSRSQLECQDLKLQLQKQKEAHEKDQQLIKVLCENLDQYKSGLPCSQCKLYEIEINTLKQNMDLQSERIDQLQKESFTQSTYSKVPRSPVNHCEKTVRSGALSEITNFQSITYHNDNKLDVYNPVTIKKAGSMNKRKSDTFGIKIQSNNLTSSTNSFRFSPCNQICIGNALSERPQFKSQSRTALEGKIDRAIEESVKKTIERKVEDFDDFLSKSAQKLKRIIKECSTAKKKTPYLQDKENSSQRESMIVVSTFNLKNYSSLKNESFQTSNEDKKPNRFQQKLCKLQESKSRLQERLSFISNQSRKRNTEQL